MEGTTTGPQIAVDSLNRPHIAADTWFAPVQYGFRVNGTWVVEPLKVGWGMADIDIDSTGRPHIAGLWNYDPYRCFYAVRTNGTWDHYEAPFAYEIKLDSKGNPHLLSARRISPSLHNLQHAYLSGGSWIVEDIPSLIITGYIGWVSFALGPDDTPHVLVYDDRGYIQKNVTYAHETPRGWEFEIIESGVYESYGWKHGSLAIAPDGTPHAAYYAQESYDYTRRFLRHAIRTISGWKVETVDSEGLGFNPTILVSTNGTPRIGYVSSMEGIFRIKYAAFGGESWNIEYALNFSPPSGLNPTEFALDRCDNPHLVFNTFDSIDGSRVVMYATKGKPCPPEPEENSVSLDIDPDTLNLKSRGRWITAYMRAENASVHDIDVSTILLQDALVPERWDFQGDILMLKFNRQELQSLLQIGDSIEIKLSGKWKDGESFEAYDYIRVINPGKK